MKERLTIACGWRASSDAVAGATVLGLVEVTTMSEPSAMPFSGASVASASAACAAPLYAPNARTSAPKLAPRASDPMISLKCDISRAHAALGGPLEFDHDVTITPIKNCIYFCDI
jgi:hypothetical protein